MSANPWCHLDAPDLDRLDLASIMVAQALDTPYLVGSCLKRPDYRDVDIRVVLADEHYDRLFGPPPIHRDALRHLIQAAISEHYVKATGLRIDFQIQRRTEANEQHRGKGYIHPLGIYPTVVEQDEGCDCTELCEMGPTCPGGSLAGLAGSGCWRQDPDGGISDPDCTCGLAVGHGGECR